MTPEREFEMQVEGLAADVLQLFVAEGKPLDEAMQVLYESRIFKALERPETGLYHQSPVYIYDRIIAEREENAVISSCHNHVE